MKPYILAMLTTVNRRLLAPCLFVAALLMANVALAAEHTHTKPLGKPSQAVVIQGTSVLNMDANSSQVFTLKLKVKTAGVETITLVAKPDSNIAVSLTSDAFNVAANGVVEVPITLQATNNGRFYVMFQASLHSQASSLLANSVGVAVQVGPREGQSHAKARAFAADSSEPKVHSFTAQESVSEKK